ncbi:hypothetical protein BDZ94DRAFT_1304642 [Collybia nuda]|uniref:Uncharacterized protein n=1 Tax=Collybia nuda TaxID=64659 RepID=A0A9P6CJ48_9AGAR|nr:hypothetical protein BDZ94DRAFT_1304642 [Collybia nuda]
MNSTSSANEMTFIKNSLRFPPELLHKILIHVIGNSIHTICIFPESVEWELGVYKTLRCVSSTFKSLTTEIFRKCFVISQEESESKRVLDHNLSLSIKADTLPSSLPHLIAGNFDYLRILAERLSHSSKNGGNLFPPSDIYRAVPLMHGYALFIISVDMRYNVVHSSSEIYELSSLSRMKALDVALGLCKYIEPEGINEVIYDALRNEQDLVHSAVLKGLEIVKAFSKLKTHLSSFNESANGCLARMQSASQIFIHEELQVIEKAHPRYTQVMSTHRFTPGGDRRKISELSGIVPVLRELCALQMEADKYGIHERLIYLVGEWSASCPFLNP